MSYFAKPNFIIYDEWFDDDLNKSKLNVKKKIKNISTLHEFFYEQSNYKVGASENNLEFDIKINESRIFSNNYLENTSEINTSVSNRNSQFFEKLETSKLKFNITKKILYSLSIFSFAFIVGFLLFFISQSKKNESNITNKSFILKKV